MFRKAYLQWWAPSLVGLCLLVSAHAEEEGATEPHTPYAGQAPAAAEGEALFGHYCQQCHNSRGKGGKAPQLIKGAWGPGGAHSDAFMYRVIAGGRPGKSMGAFGGTLSSDQIWQIVTFLRQEAKRTKAAEADEDN